LREGFQSGRLVGGFKGRRHSDEFKEKQRQK